MFQLTYIHLTAPWILSSYYYFYKYFQNETQKNTNPFYGSMYLFFNFSSLTKCKSVSIISPTSSKEKNMFGPKQRPGYEISISWSYLAWRRPTLAGAMPQLPSALESLTAVFGMGTGVSSPLLLPDIFNCE